MSVKKLMYADINDMPTVENDEPLVKANTFDESIILDTDTYVEKPTPEDIIFWVRESVAQKLANVNESLEENTLVLGYGFRPMEIQEEIFEKIRNQLGADGTLDKETLLERTHQLIAAPEFAGHPTGGAVDVTLVDSTGKRLDMGTPFLDIRADGVELSREAKNLTPEQIENRKILTEAMQSEGFTPFWGEWWHFSYGDTEWAVYFEKKNAIYTQKKTSDVVDS